MAKKHMLRFEDLEKGKEKIAVVGLGYVGLPLAVALSKHFQVVGFDISKQRIEELKGGMDFSGEVSAEELKNCKVEFVYLPDKLKECKLIIVAVPTPVDKLKSPDLSYLKEASRLVGQNLNKGAVVVYESTVYPGVTEDFCVPILEKESGLRWKEDFRVGYSPERVNPGDREHSLERVIKVVAGDTEETLELLAKVYETIVKAGIYKARDIRTAEAAKVIENIQRDINIALINELAMIFHKLGLNTKEVLEAASTKWNFLKFEPGLVGGHCIPVDPYYLAHKALEVGHVPELILAGRGVNEQIPVFVAQETIKLLIKSGKRVKDGSILVLGLTFKENVPDIRNSKVFEMVQELKTYGTRVWVYDPHVRENELKGEGDVCLIENISKEAPYEAIILAVKHKTFMESLTLDFLREISTEPPILVDIKSVFSREEAKKIGFIYWSL